MNARKAEVLLRERGVRRIRWIGPDLAPLGEGFEPGTDHVVLWQSASSAESGGEGGGEVALLTIPSGEPLTLVTQIPDFTTTPTVPEADAAASARGLLTAYYTSATESLPLAEVPERARVLGNHADSPANKTVPVGTTVGVIVQLARPA
jgi:hypothetical protein